MPTYAAQAKVGKVDGFATPVDRTAAPGDGRGRRRERLCLSGDRAALDAVARDRARSTASRAAAIRRSHHCGAAGHPVERLAERRPRRADVRQYAGRDRAVGRRESRCSAPIRSPSPVPCPAGRRSWSTSSLSKVARGNILAAKQKGERIPEGWALDAARPADHRSRRRARRHHAAARRRQGHGAGADGGAARRRPHRREFRRRRVVVSRRQGPAARHRAAHRSRSIPPPSAARSSTLRALAASIETQPGARLPGARRLAARRKAASEGFMVDDALVAASRGCRVGKAAPPFVWRTMPAPPCPRVCQQFGRHGGITSCRPLMSRPPLPTLRICA